EDADGMDVLRLLGEPDVAEDGAALLGEARHVDHAAGLALEMRRHAEDGADRDHTRAADAGNDDVPRPAIEVGQLRLGQHAPVLRALLHLGGGRLLQLGAVHGDEGRAEAVDAGKILVAVRLVDEALAAELGLQRLHGDAVRLDAAVAAALADELVDDDALVGIRELALLAPAPLLGRAGLVVDQRGDAGDAGKLALYRLELVAVVEGDARRPRDGCRIFVRLVRDEGDALDAFGPHLPRDHVHREVALVVLAARHGDGIVEQDLVGDVGLRRDGPAQGEDARVVVGAVAEVLEDVPAL